VNLPSLKDAQIISIDVETNDPGLLDRGPGGIRGEGYLIGLSVATPDGFAEYFPLKHESGNVENPEQVIAWAKDELKGNQPKLGANILYDLEWLKVSGVEVGGLKYDVQTAEPLLDENKSTYKLEALAQEYLGEGKDERGMIGAGLKYGISPEEIKNKLWMLPGFEVSKYGKTDAVLPLRIFEKQRAKLINEELWDLFLIETKLLDLMLAMRFKGVPVDIEKADILRKDLDTRNKLVLAEIRKLSRPDIDIWSNNSIGDYCRSVGIDFLMTDKDNPSFCNEWLEDQDNPFFKKVLEARQLDRAGSVFIQSKIIDSAVNGRVYPQFFATRRDDYGTRSGRFSSANPNLQQVPSREENLGPKIRSLFVSEPGKTWCKLDYSQQEFRVLIHYAVLLGLPGAEEAKRNYDENPDTDFHQMVADMAGIGRRPAKSINLGLSYGMGKDKLAMQLGMDMATAKEIIEKYHRGLPFIRPLTDRAAKQAERVGFVKTILGRRRRYNLYGPPRGGKGIQPLSKEDAIKKWGPNVIRYFTYRAWNSVDQGSSADMMKKAMLVCWDAGLVPNITVHDELDFADADERTMKIAHEAMRDCMKLLVPMKVDVTTGPSWGEQKSILKR
jgi:DNA polymerase I-like protein with 3'-5' exonuclease and polymerase domains